MRLSRQDQRNYAILAVFLLIAGYVLYTLLSTPDAPPPAAVAAAIPPAPGTGGALRKAAIAETQLDPTLHMEAMLVTESLVYSGSGRNIFSAASAPAGPDIAIPRPVASARTPPAAPPVLTPTGPPPPPPIDLKFFGTETNAAGMRRAFLLHGEDVFLASAGEIVQRRYRVVSIDARSLVIEDIANSNRQTLPLLAGVTP